ncbi:MAG: YdcF family protein [Leptolyngbyaceae cyanobacterium]
MENAYDAILVPGGGVRDEGQLPLWTQRRLDCAVERSSEHTYIITLSAGTTHKPPPSDAEGYPIFESVAAAKYLMQKGIAPEKVLVETSSYDTIGNAYFSRVIHADPLNLRCLLVITSEFHMPRTKMIFEWVYGLIGDSRDYHISFETVSDRGIDPRILTARQQKESQSLKTLLQTVNAICTLRDLHQWLFQYHGAYAVACRPARELGEVLKTY